MIGPQPAGLNSQNFLASFWDSSKLHCEMSKRIIGDQLWAEMTEGQKVDAVFKGHATLKQMSEGLLDGSEKLRNACQEFLSHTSPSFENLPVAPEQQESSTISTAGVRKRVLRRKTRGPRAGSPRGVVVNRSRNRNSGPPGKQRFGLPEGFVPRLQRFGRSVLLESNVYQLPNGQEFIPSCPSGTLGARQHLYALLTNEQYLGGKRGSIYVRSDGRIFDYSVVSANPLGDMFDTGYTIYDLERTGRYAPVPGKRRKKSQPAKVRRAAAAG
jgi:hypothetical protein